MGISYSSPYWRQAHDIQGDLELHLCTCHLELLILLFCVPVLVLQALWWDLHLNYVPLNFWKFLSITSSIILKHFINCPKLFCNLIHHMQLAESRYILKTTINPSQLHSLRCLYNSSHEKVRMAPLSFLLLPINRNMQVCLELEMKKPYLRQFKT